MNIWNFNNTFENIIKIVKDKSLAKEQRNQKIVNAISPIFDFELMAKLSLGKVWKSLKKDDKKAEETLSLQDILKEKNS